MIAKDIYEEVHSRACMLLQSVSPEISLLGRSPNHVTPIISQFIYPAVRGLVVAGGDNGNAICE